VEPVREKDEPVTPSTPQPPESGDLLPRLETWLTPYGAEFRRQDQKRWAAAYLMGLLQPGQRKTIENMARTLALQSAWRTRDVAQALQHFIDRSPWDANRVASCLQSHLAPSLSPKGYLVIEEMTFVKQGRHSVGVQRQLSSALGRKVNCQVAVGIHH